MAEMHYRQAVKCRGRQFNLGFSEGQCGRGPCVEMTVKFCVF